MDLRRHLTGQNIALVTVFAGFIAASTLWGGVEFAAGVPFTLQTFAVLLAGAVLGPWRGAAAVLIYLLLGTAGLPIFAGHTTGAVAWPSATAGFLIGFLPAAFVTGWIVRGLRRRSALTFSGAFGAAVMGGLVVLYPIGWGYVAWKAGLDFTATVIGAAPFAVFDLIKCVFVGLVATAVHRAYPWILPAKPQSKVTSVTDAAPASGSEANEALATA
ncbi:biotin transporter BioY [Demequina sp.]|uniref:biotin transporter BioY n=1 Tax=Demequina sp. TaxID=2050685 RepID=UPI003D09B3A3